MQPSSAAFAAALSASHVSTSLITVNAALSTVPLATLAVLTGSVTIDATRSIRRTCTLTLQDPTGQLVPSAVTDLLHPLSGNELHLWRGVLLPTGPELIPLGVFGTSKPTVKDTASGLEIGLTGNDRSQTITRAQWLAPFTPSGTIPAALQALLLDRWPGLPTFNLAPSTYSVPGGTAFGLDQSSNPWADGQSLATVAGQEVLFDAQGVPTSRPVSDPATSPVNATYAEGATATVLEFDRDLDESRAYNTVVVTTQPADGSAPLRSVAPAVLPSPVAPYFYSSALITSQAQCDATAAGLLLSLRNAVEEVTFTAVPDPRLDAGDIVMLTRARSRLAAPYRVQAITMPLEPTGTMQVTCSPRQAA